MTHRTQDGFTIFEVLLVIAMGTLLVALTLPIGLRFYQTQTADETTLELKNSVIGARDFARLGKNGGTFGIHFGEGQYTVFQGGSYATRIVSEDRLLLLPAGTTITTTINEIVFAAVSGKPNATGTMTISAFGNHHTLVLNESGVVAQAD